eukprot:TRINITY_DN11291_c0_g1_i2.p1 TRINITY_DN11291_c0_g1~~TRINITY_DN11291_c0_g1_i2.p1  ORF type:complete len:148 (-),score=46.15 TRINITY_DN11291_c0_g1_i2:97-540(-)
MESRGKRKKFSDQPRDIQNIVSILQKMGIEKFESNVPHMLFEFSHSFAQEVLEDSRNFAEYAGRQKIDASDVQLAIQNYNEKYFTRSLRPDFLKELANVRNKVPIPPPPAVSSLDIDFPPTDMYAMQNDYQVDSEEVRAFLAHNKPR